MNARRKISKIVGISLSAAAVAVGLTACGSKDTDKDKPVETTEYTVTFNTDGGSAVNSKIVASGGKVTKPTDPTKDGYTFGGWLLNGQPFDFNSAITGNITLTAKWDEAVVEHTVTFKVGEDTTTSATVGGKVTKPADPTKEGDKEFVNHVKKVYVFDGWYNGSTKFDFDSVVTEDITLTAVFKEEKVVEDGWELVVSELDTKIFKSALPATDVKSGPFTLKAGGALSTRSRGRVYAQGTDEEMTFTHSMKLDDKGSFRVTATGNGTLTIIIQNGSSGVSSQSIIFGEVVEGAVDTTTGTTYEFGPSELYKLEFEVEAGKEYYVARPSGTVDIYYAKIEQVMEEAPVTGIEITTNGTQKFFAGSTFDTTGLSVVAVKGNGAKLAVDLADLTIDSSAVNMSAPGVYTVSVKYQEFTAQSYDVEVYALDSIELGFNMIEKLSTNSVAGNGQYFNQTVQQVYGLNDNLDKDALTIKAYSAEKTYGEYVSLDSSAVSFSNVDMSTAGEKTVVVTVNLNGIEKSKEYKIYVVDTAICKVTEGETVTEVNVYVDSTYTGVIGQATNVGAVSKNCNAFRTIQQALDYLGMQDDLSTVRKNVYIASGTYNEKLEITLPYISLIGLGGRDNTIIEWDSIYGRADEGGFIHTTDSTATVAIRDTAANCIIDGLTISNYFNTINSFVGTEYEGNGERGLAMLVQSDMFILQNSSLLGWQDTIELFYGRQLIKNSYISGCVDFIFGTNNTTLFDNCEIHAVKGKSNASADKVSSYLTAFKGCNRGADDYVKYGVIFNECDFTADSDFVGKIAVGRCWGAYSAVSIINSTFCDKITDKASEAIVSMNAKNNVSTLKYFFYGNTKSGEAFAFTEDLKDSSGNTISHVLAEDLVANYTNYSEIFGTSNGAVTYKLAWNPEYTGVVVDNNIYYDFGSLSSTTGTVYKMENTEAGAYQATLGGLTIDTAKCKNFGTYTEVQTGTMKLTVPAGSMLTVNTGYNTQAALTVNGLGLSTANFVHYYVEETEVTLTFSGKVYILGIQVTPNASKPADATISSIDVEGTPVDEIQVGTDLDLSGLKVKVNYSDNTYKYVNDYTIDADTVVDKTQAGVYTVTVTYEGQTKTFDVKYVSSVSDTFEDDILLDFSTGKAADTLSSSKITVSSDFTYGNNNYTQITAGTFSFKVKEGAHVVVTDFGGQYGDISVNGVSTSGNGAVIDAVEDMTITIGVGATGQKYSYLKSITITYPAPVISETTRIAFGSDNAYSSTKGVTITATCQDNATNSTKLYGGNIEFKVAAGAKVAIYLNYSCDFTYNGTRINGRVGTGDGQVAQNYVLIESATEETTVVIECDTDSTGDNYFYWIDITYPSAE